MQWPIGELVTALSTSESRIRLRRYRLERSRIGGFGRVASLDPWLGGRRLSLRGPGLVWGWDC